MSRGLVAPVITAVVSVVVSTAIQIVLPAAMLSRWGSAGYSLVIALQGFAMYVSVADVGVQAFLTQRIAVAFARGESGETRAVAVSALKTLGMLATAGSVVVTLVFVLFGSEALRTVAGRAGVSVAAASVAFIAQTIATGVGVALSGWSTSVEAGTGHYQRAQVAGLLRTSSSVAVLVSMAAVRTSPTVALTAQAIGLMLFDAVRIALARGLLPAREPAVVGPSPMRLLADARGSVVLALGGATQNGLQPAIIAILSANAAASAIPARTLANAARTFAMAVSGVLWVPLAAKLARDANPAESFVMWRRASPVLALLILAGIVLLLLGAPIVVPLWLPKQSPMILQALPFFAAEQAAFMAAFPSFMLLQALGRFGHVGAYMFAMSLVGVALTYLLVPHGGAVGFGTASLLATAVVYAPGLVASEYIHWRRANVPAGSLLLQRCGLSMAAIVLCLLYGRHPVAAAALLVALTGACIARFRPWQLMPRTSA